MSTKTHGGDCCGISHVYGLNYLSNSQGRLKSSRKSWFLDQCNYAYRMNARRRIGLFWNCNPDSPDLTGNHSIQVTLQHQQLHKWKTILQELGFEKVYEFTNANSSNVVSVWMTVMEKLYVIPNTTVQARKPVFESTGRTTRWIGPTTATIEVSTEAAPPVNQLGELEPTF